jgi:hypothetical protein
MVNQFWKCVGVLGVLERPLENACYRLAETFSKNVTLEEREKRMALFAGYTLYGFRISTYSLKARIGLKRLGLDLPMKDILESEEAYRELMAGGKRDLSPCLRIDHPGKPSEWIYHARKIVEHCEARIKSELAK